MCDHGPLRWWKREAGTHMMSGQVHVGLGLILLHFGGGPTTKFLKATNNQRVVSVNSDITTENENLP